MNIDSEFGEIFHCFVGKHNVFVFDTEHIMNHQVSGAESGAVCRSPLVWKQLLLFLQSQSVVNIGPAVLAHCPLPPVAFRRESPHDAVVLHPKHRGQTLDTLPENRYGQIDQPPL